MKKSGIWLPLVLCLAFWTGVGYCAISSVDFSDPAVKAEIRVDGGFRVLPKTKTVDIVLERVYLDAMGKEVRREYIGNAQLMDSEATETEPARTGYTDIKTEIDALLAAVENTLKVGE